MILDRISHCHTYAAEGTLLAKGFSFIQEFLSNPKPAGRYEVEGDRVFAMVQEYDTKLVEEKKWEAHRKYIDIQFVVSGNERCGWAHLSDCILEDYVAEKDFQPLQVKGCNSGLSLSEGQFAVFYPWDAHMPGIADGEPAPVTKIVVKVAVE